MLLAVRHREETGFRWALISAAAQEAIIRVDDLPAAEALWFVNGVRGPLRSEWLQCMV